MKKTADADFVGSEHDVIGEPEENIRDSTRELERQKKLLYAVNRTASLLLSPSDDTDFKAYLSQGMEVIGRCVNADSFCIWQNEKRDEELFFVKRYEWISDNAGYLPVPVNTALPYSKIQEWVEIFSQGKGLNGPLYSLPQNTRDFLKPLGLKSTLMIPVHMQDQLWGFICFNDCREERIFKDDEVDILRSAGLMIVNAMNRSVREKNLREAQEHTQILLDAMPMICRLWRKDSTRPFYCNEESVKLFKTKDKNDYLERYFEFFPDIQGGGHSISEKAEFYLNKAFDEGRCTFNGVYRASDGTQIPSEITLVRVKFGEEDIIAGYSRDLREHTRMLKNVQQRDKLLRMSNDAASVLLSTNSEDDFEASLQKGMEIMGHNLDVDRVQIWQNKMIDGELFFVLEYQWLSEFGRHTSSAPILYTHSYRNTPEWDKRFSQNEYINKPFSDLSEEDQETLKPFEIKTIVLFPLFIQNRFWGFFSFDDCRNEHTFAEDEIDIIRSGCLMMVNALYRSTQAMQLNEAHERTLVLLDAMPLTCRLWHRGSNKPFFCNEESVKLFNTKDKDDFLERYREFLPEYQADGRLSSEKSDYYFNKAFDEGRCTFEWTYQASDGTPIPSEVTLVRVKYGDENVITGYSRDLREYKRMMREIERRDNQLNVVNTAAAFLLQSATEKFENDLYQSMGMIAKTMEIDRIYIWRNSVKESKLYCSQIYEWSGGARPVQNSEFATDIPYEKIAPSWEIVLSRGNCINGITKEMPREEYEHLSSQDILSIFVMPVFWRDLFWGFVGFDDCHRERVFTESEQSILRSGGIIFTNALLRNEMTQSIRTSAEQLKDALEEARQANNAKSRFLARMSHEMRTPLNAVIGLSELALGSGVPDNECFSSLEKINNAGMTLLSTVNDILDISKIEAGKFELVPVEYDLPSLLNDAITQSIMHIGEKPIQFLLDIDGNLPARLYGDDLRVKQILNNLLSNAFKYTKEGIVEFGMHCSRAETQLPDKSDSSPWVWIDISVRDTGKGIRSEEIKNLFIDYSKLDTEYNRYIEGTGLGLSITKGIVKMMDGEISVESEFGKGSVFSAQIKQKRVNDSVIGAETAESLKNFHYSDQRRSRNSRMMKIRLPYAKVLVVDDVATNLDVTKGMLKPYGMQVDCVSSGQEAVDLIRGEKVKYSVIFMDHMMPEMDGVEATRIIREEIGTEYAKTVPIIAITANAVVGNEEMFLNMGFQAFISKPIEIGRLDAVIREWVRDRELEKTLGGISLDDEIVPDVRSGKDRRGTLDRRTGSDRRITGRIVSGLDMEKGVQRFGGNEGAYLEVLHSYAHNTLPILESLRNITGVDLAEYAIKVHGIKGASQSICAGPVSAKAEALEKAAKAGNNEFVMANNGPFIDAVEDLLGNLETMLREIAVDEPKTKRDRIGKEEIEKIITACENFDMDGLDRVIEEVKNCEYETDAELAAWLVENSGEAKFSAIRERLSTLKNISG